MKPRIYYSALLCILTACKDTPNQPVNEIPTVNYDLVRYFPHDTLSFTEGLLFHNGSLFESTGSPADAPQLQSLAGKVDLTNGKIAASVKLDNKKYFGEGIVFLKNKLFQLTYTNKLAFVYDASTWKLIDSFPYLNNEGWGLTTDGTHVIMSDGTSNITYLDPDTYKVVKMLHVTDDQGGVNRLNELEYVKGFLYANIYTTNTIVKIDTETGRVVARLNLSSLYTKAKTSYAGALEMNGIAYDSTAGSFYVTGKLWPAIYEIRFPH